MEKQTNRRPTSGGMRGKLSDKAVKAFVSKAAPGEKLADGGGLYLHISSAGSPIWRVKYRFDGKEKLYTIGSYPLHSLATARIELGEVKAFLLQHKDPVVERRIHKARNVAEIDNTFTVVAERWLAMKKKEWSKVHFKKSSRAIERDIYPSMGDIPISSITASIVAKAIEDINKRDVLETASRILQHLNGIFRFAQAQGLCRDNPANAVREILPRRKANKKLAALITWPELGELLRSAERAKISPAVRMAHRLLAFTAAIRISNVVEARWDQFRLDEAQPIWIIPREKMKVKSREGDHVIPLCPQLVLELRQWQSIVGGRGFVFPSSNGQNHISRESLEKVYRTTLKMRGKHVPHGWRSSLSTLAHEHGFSHDTIELALDHPVGSKSSQHYDRGNRFPERIELFNWWGTNLQSAQEGTPLITPRIRGLGA